MEKSDEFILGRIKWKASQFTLPTKFSFYFEHLSSDIKEYLNNQIKKVSGTPVLFFTKPTKEWTLICTRQVIFSDTKNTSAVNIRDIKQILPAEFDPSIIGEININKIKKKSEWGAIRIIDDQNHYHILYANEGSDLFALWNILLMAMTINK